MTFSRLTWIADWHMRDETYTKALAEIIVKVISATARDAPHMVDGLLHHETDLAIREHYTDTWGKTRSDFWNYTAARFRVCPTVSSLTLLTAFRARSRDKVS
jgi:TnpA family transposase